MFLKRFLHIFVAERTIQLKVKQALFYFINKVPSDGKGQGWIPEPPIILVRYLKRNSGGPLKTSALKVNRLNVLNLVAGCIFLLPIFNKKSV